MVTKENNNQEGHIINYSIVFSNSMEKAFQKCHLHDRNANVMMNTMIFILTACLLKQY